MQPECKKVIVPRMPPEVRSNYPIGFELQHKMHFNSITKLVLETILNINKITRYYFPCLSLNLNKYKISSH